VKRLRPDTEILFIGTRGHIEARVVPAAGYAFRPIWISGFARRLSLQALLFPLKLVVAMVQSLWTMIRLRPAVVVGTGGYVCGPPLLTASLMGIPTLIQEQNSYPGVTTRVLAARVTEVHLTFPGSQRFLTRAAHVHISGNPTRDLIGRRSREEGAAFFALDPGRLTVLVFGGSQGASSLNKAVSAAISTLVAEGIQLVWGTGEHDFVAAQAAVQGLPPEGRSMVSVHRYVEKIEFAYAACDLAVTRAGATTVAELARVGIPSVLVPYPFAAADHQTENAKAMADAGAAVMVRDSDLVASLLPTVRGLLSDSHRLRQMAEHASALGHSRAAEELAVSVIRLAKV
jgi:UDP-N-acetylglucosamine--N-acetylmuramyl-(pentapeptide) pyrophosphoryl-undecaprenol N-acetylglucosamine transferase